MTTETTSRLFSKESRFFVFFAGLGLLGLVLGVAFSGSIGTPPSNAGQGVADVTGYQVSNISYDAYGVNGLGNVQDVPIFTVSFDITRETTPAPVDGSTDRVFVQFRNTEDNERSDWVQCSIPADNYAVCDVASLGYLFSDATAISVVAFESRDGSPVPPGVVAVGGITGTYAVGSQTWKYHRFASTAAAETFAVDYAPGRTNFEYLVVAGGGGGGGRGGGGGGGAGGVLNGTITLGRGVYPVVVGSGGSGGPNTGDDTGGDVRGTSGENSSFIDFVSVGGGGGGGGSSATFGGRNGGSGGGSSATDTANPAGTGTDGQGNSGGIGPGVVSNPGGGGGGGKTGAGGNGAASNVKGARGAGLTSLFSGTSVLYGEGGEGGVLRSLNGTGGRGGGSETLPGANRNGLPGGTNTGGGGGGGGGAISSHGNGGAGGSGVVIIRYRVS